mmetsp:Transcript_55325/g.161473  ORF Transcript_55325/g.161473 Transcript_55325/m.161473 type:complete len:624 (-) Transcript_55325:50-1921(-)
MAAATGAAEEADIVQLVFQKSRKLHGECFIISVHDNAGAACLLFSAYELESAETHKLSYSHAEFDAMFQAHPDLADPANKEGRYSWVVDRLDLVSEAGGANKRLTLSSEVTEAGQGSALPSARPTSSSRRAPSRDRLTYAERVKLREEAEKLEAKRASNAGHRHERNRKAFVAELNEKRKLEELKQTARRQRIEEDRAERRERAEMDKHIRKERARRYDENDRKRDERIGVLESERRVRDRAAIQDILDKAKASREAKHQRLEEARQQKREAEAAQTAEQAANREAQEQIAAKRDARIAERKERVKHAEKEYLEQRKYRMDELARERLHNEEKRKTYIRDKAAQRAAQLRSKHEAIQNWETLEDERTHNNIRKDRARNMFMVSHIDNLRQKYNQELADAAGRKQAALQQRKSTEAKEAASKAEESRRLQEVELKREQSIAAKETKRKEKNQNYCEQIRDHKTREALRVKEGQEHAESASERSRQEHSRESQARLQEEAASAAVAARREENIRSKERERDARFAREVQEAKERERQRAVEMEAKKTQRRLQEREEAEKQQDELGQRRERAAKLDEQRDAAISERSRERHEREQARWRGAATSEQEVEGGEPSVQAEAVAATGES